MQAIKDLGYNTLQLNIAWGARPADEPLNLEDILYVDGIGSREKADQRLQAIKERARIAKKWGFRTLFHFGAPRVDSLYKILTPDLIDTFVNHPYTVKSLEDFKKDWERRFQDSHITDYL